MRLPASSSARVAGRKPMWSRPVMGSSNISPSLASWRCSTKAGVRSGSIRMRAFPLRAARPSETDAKDVLVPGDAGIEVGDGEGHVVGAARSGHGASDMAPPPEGLVACDAAPVGRLVALAARALVRQFISSAYMSIARSIRRDHGRRPGRCELLVDQPADQAVSRSTPASSRTPGLAGVPQPLDDLQCGCVGARARREVRDRPLAQQQVAGRSAAQKSKYLRTPALSAARGVDGSGPSMAFANSR